MTKKLAGKVALVTGGSRGIGAAIARALADDGADVVISYASSADKAAAAVRELEGKGVRAAAVKAEQANPAEVERLVNGVVQRFGRLDILVNSAGVFVTGVVGDPANDIAAFDRQFAINVGGVAAAVRAAAPLMGEGGRIISIGSGAGTNSPWRGIADYSATKAAIAGYTRGGRATWAPKASPSTSCSRATSIPT
jgi:3-oxoacyl-[acyl-carrier protein] reductase